MNTKMKSTNDLKRLMGLLYCYLLSFSFVLSSEVFAATEDEHLDPLDIFMSVLSENKNEPNKPQTKMEITDITPVKATVQHVFPLDFTASMNPNVIPDSTFIFEPPSPEPTKELMQANISILSNDDNSKVKTELENLIEQVRLIQVKSEHSEPQTTTAEQPPESREHTANTETEENLEKPEESNASITEKELSYIPISEDILQALDRLVQHPEEVDNPFELAELLFLSNHLEKAAVFYTEALSRTTTVSSISAQRKAWILFQTGNCLQKTKPDEAKKLYTQLVNEFPDSCWTEPAKCQIEIIDWIQKDQPEKIISDINP